MVLMIVFLNQVWEGTTHKIFFSTRYLTVVTILYVIHIGVNTFLLLNNFQNVYEDYTEVTKTLDIFTKGINMVNVTYFYGIMVWNGIQASRMKRNTESFEDN